MSSGKLFQTAGVTCEKARSAKARLVRSRFGLYHRLVDCVVERLE